MKLFYSFLIIFSYYHLYSNTIIEETDSSFIGDISNVEFSPNGKKFLINDWATGNISIYQTKSGKLLHLIESTSSYSDSIYSYYMQNIEYDSLYLMGNNFIPTYIYELNNSFGFNIKKESLNRFNQNNFLFSSFLNNNMIASTCLITLNGLMKKDEEHYSWVPFSQTALVKIDLKNLHSKIFYINEAPLLNQIYDEDITLNPYFLLHDNKKYYLQNRNDLIRLKDNRQPYFLIQIQNGIKKPVFFLPQEYIETNLFYQYTNFSADINALGDIFHSYGLLPYIYKNGSKLFQLKPLEKFKLNNFFRNKEIYNPDENNSNFLKQFHYIISKIITTKNHIYILIAFQNKSIENRYLIQKYDYKGSLISEYNDLNNNEFNFKQLAYNMQTNAIYLFGLENDNYVLKKIDF